MRVAVLVVLFAAVCVMGDGEAAKDVNLEEIEKVDSSVFNAEPLVKASPLEQAAAAVVSARDADLDQDTETVVSLATESAGTSGEDQTMYSFRAMRQATEVAGSSVSEKSSETHAAAKRMLLHGNSVSAEDMFAEISREQQILVAKRALVARQKQSIVDSEESLGRLKRLIGENRSILAKNEHALRRASDDLLRLISKYQNKLRAGLTKEVGATADTPLGVPVRSRPHQRAAYTKWAERGKRTVDTTKSEAALKAANTADAAKPKPAAAAKKPAAKPAAKKSPAAAAKAKFAQVHTEETAAAAAADAEESDDSSEAEAETETESSEESEDESEDEAESEDSEDSESESESESEAEAESEDSEESEASETAAAEASLLEDDAAYNPSGMDRAAALPGLAPPPHLYDPTRDEFI